MARLSPAYFQLRMAVGLLALVATPLHADTVFFDHQGIALKATHHPSVVEPGVPLRHNGVRVDDPGTLDVDTFRVLEVYDNVPSTDGFPLTWADIISNTFVRPTYQKGDGTSGQLGTSVVGSISFRTPAGLQFIPTVARADVTTGGVDRIETVLTAAFGTAARVTCAHSFPAPTIGETVTGLAVRFEAAKDIDLDASLLGSDAFRLLTLSSMFATEQTYDANVLRYEDADGTMQAVRLTNGTPRGAHVFPAAVEVGTWFELVKEADGQWVPDSPTVRVEVMSTEGIGGRLGVQGFLADTSDPNDDSLSVWLEWIDAPPRILEGTDLASVFRVVATPPVVGTTTTLATSSTATTSTTTTSSTMLPAGCATAGDCADGDSCTDDQCNAGRCSNPGTSGIACAQAKLAALDPAAPCGSETLDPRLIDTVMKKLAKANALLGKAETTPSTKTRAKRVKKSRKQLAQIVKKAKKFAGKDVISDACLQAITAAITGVRQALPSG